MFGKSFDQHAVRIGDFDFAMFAIYQNELRSIDRDIRQQPIFLRIEQFAFIEIAANR